jgi:hypothetical protein
MCLGSCLEKGVCEKVLTGKTIVSDDGKRLVYLSPGKKEPRSIFRGDADYEVKNGKIFLKEKHNIEVKALWELLQHGAINYTILGDRVRSSLKNDAIYNTLVYQRVQSLIRRDWVVNDSNPWEGQQFVITSEGKKYAIELFANRYKF